MQNDVASEALTIAIASGVPVLLWGSPGTGKTSAVVALAETIAWPCEVVIGSIREPTDFGGLPVVFEGGVNLAPPAWAKRLFETGHGLLFLDELTTAPPAVQAAMLRVVLERTVGDLRLPAAVRVVAAANPPDEAADGWELAPPLANRLVHLDWPVDGRYVARGLAVGFPAPSLHPFDGGRPDATSRLTARATVAAFLEIRPDLVLQLPRSAADSGRGWPSPRSRKAATVARAVSRAGLVGPSAVEGEEGRHREPDGEPARDVAAVGRPVEMDEPVREWRRELPAVGRLVGRVRRRHDAYGRRELQVADRPLEDDPEHRGLHRGRRRRQLVEEEQAVADVQEPLRPGGRGQVDAAFEHHGQPAEVGRLADRADHDLARPLDRLGERDDGRGLSGARAAPEQHRDAG